MEQKNHSTTDSLVTLGFYKVLGVVYNTKTKRKAFRCICPGLKAKQSGVKTLDNYEDSKCPCLFASRDKPGKIGGTNRVMCPTENRGLRKVY